MVALTCCTDFVQRTVRLTWWVTGNVVSKTDGRQGDEAVVQWVRVVPLRLQPGKDTGRNQHYEHYVTRRYDEQVENTNVKWLKTTFHLIFEIR